MKQVKIKDICNKGSSSLKQKELNQTGKYPVYGASGIAGFLDTFQQPNPYIGIVKDGSGIGRVDFYGAETSLIGTMQYILPKDGYNIRYIGYCLQSLDLSNYRQGAAIPHIYFRDYGERIVTITDDIAEQERIVERLDAAFAEIDSLKANAEQQLKEGRALFQAALTQAMTPKQGWQEKTLGDICDIIAGGDVPKPNFSKERTNTYKVPIFSNGIVNDGLYGYTDIPRITKESITISARGTIGFVSKRMEPFYPIIRLIVATPKEKTDISFLRYCAMDKHFESNGVAVPQLTVPMIKNAKISMPPLVEQVVIAKYLDDLSDGIKELEEINRKTAAECDALKQAILRETFD